jgi:uncharacterized membrane protein HdeD (DUF308 family)
MGVLLGFLTTILGVGLLISGLLVPRPLFTAGWQSVLALIFLAVGYLFSAQASSGASKPLAGLMALLGIVLVFAAVVPRMLGFSLYSLFGDIFRIVLGLILVVAGYVLYEYAEEIFGYDDDL